MNRRTCVARSLEPIMAMGCFLVLRAISPMPTAKPASSCSTSVTSGNLTERWTGSVLTAWNYRTWYPCYRFETRYASFRVVYAWTDFVPILPPKSPDMLRLGI